MPGPWLGAPVRVTITDVADAAGVSKTAVSFAFNNPERLGQATLERVLRVAHDLGYTPHPAARTLSMRRSGTIGVLIPQRLSTVFANLFVGELIQGLGDLCEEHDLTLLLVPPLDGSLEGAIRQASVDGFISLGLSPRDPALEALAAMGIPTVLVDSEDSSEHPVVNVDDRGGAEAAARHLLQLGHRELAVIVLPPTRAQVQNTPTAARRLAGYQAAIEGVGAPAPHIVNRPHVGRAVGWIAHPRRPLGGRVRRHSRCSVDQPATDDRAPADRGEGKAGRAPVDPAHERQGGGLARAACDLARRSKLNHRGAGRGFANSEEVNRMMLSVALHSRPDVVGMDKRWHQ